MTNLVNAVQKGNIDMVLALLGHSMEQNTLEEDVNEGDPSKNGCTPIHMAISKGCFDIASLLYDHLADPNKPDNSGITPLELAEMLGCKDKLDFKSIFNNTAEQTI